jgi:hypothetical protein
MAELKWTVFYGLEEAGNQAPLTGFSKLKVKKVTTGAVMEKNLAWNSEAGWKTAEVQNAYLVTVVAESAEEACKVVNAIVSGNVDPVTGSEIQGPKLDSNVNGKFAACLSSNLEEAQVIP